MGEVRDAAKVLLDRKIAGGSSAAVLSGDPEAMKETLRLSAVGLDLDLDEVADQATEYGPIYGMALLLGVPPSAIAAGAWLDGVIVGLILAERRARGDAP